MDSLLQWYDAHRRDLPWRHDTDPYRVWVSEIMLQQTRVDTVKGYYTRWMDRFPTVTDLANAPEADVMAAWAGLGYYGRARRLHAAAKIVAAEGVPADAEGWRKLPGIGAYTAGAIASISQGQAVPAIDGNAIRVIARIIGLQEDADAGAGRKRIEQTAATRIDRARPGDWNQALMDLGSSICTPVAPRCGDCPLAASCVANDAGAQADIPVLKPKKRPVGLDMHFARIEQGGRLLVVPRPDDGLLAGTWMLPGGGADEALEDLVMAQTGLAIRLGEARAAKHVFTHRVWHMQVFDAQIIDGAPGTEGTGRWIDVAAPDVALSTAAHKAASA